MIASRMEVEVRVRLKDEVIPLCLLQATIDCSIGVRDGSYRRGRACVMRTHTLREAGCTTFRHYHIVCAVQIRLDSSCRCCNVQSMVLTYLLVMAIHSAHPDFLIALERPVW